MLRLAGALLLVVAVGAVGEEAGFRGCPWGSSMAEIKAKEMATFVAGGPTSGNRYVIGYKTEVAGFPCQAIYGFVGDRLTWGMYSFKQEHSNKTDFVDDFQKLKALLVTKYGTPGVDNVRWKNDLFKDDPSHWGLAVATGDVIFVCRWEDPETIIGLLLQGDNYEITLNLSYSSVALKDLGKEEEKQAESGGL
jgi:hypothetical protein